MMKNKKRQSHMKHGHSHKRSSKRVHEKNSSLDIPKIDMPSGLTGIGTPAGPVTG